MSAVTPLDAIRAVMASRLDASTSQVLMCWASHVDADGKAWPGAKRLSELSRLSERTVRASMGLLRRAGILLPVGTSASGTLIERLDLDALAAWAPPAVAAPPATLAPPAVVAPTPCNPCTHPLQPLQYPPAAVAPKGVSEEDREEVMEEDTPPTPSGGLTASGPPLALVEPVDPDDAALPAWSAKAHRPRGVTRAGLVRAVAEVLEVIQGRPGASATAAKPVLSLWKALEYPPLRGFVPDLRLIAEAAHDCPDRLFARDIRAEGWPDGVNREHDPTTICRHDRWDARLQTARAWEAAGKPTARGSPSAEDPFEAALHRRQQRRAPHPDDDPQLIHPKEDPWPRTPM